MSTSIVWPQISPHYPIMSRKEKRQARLVHLQSGSLPNHFDRYTGLTETKWFVAPKGKTHTASAERWKNRTANLHKPYSRARKVVKGIKS